LNNTNDKNTENNKRPLDGVTVLEMGQLIAGPQAGCMLAYFGADVIKIEPPGRGDPIRQWRLLDEHGTSYWWQSIARNKKSVTVDLKSDRGRDLIRQMIDKVDVVIENFRPGAMEKWGLDPAQFTQSNPALIYTRVSGYGQTGPLSSRPGYASACEAYGGFRHVNGFPDRPPVRPNLSLGDTLAAMHAVIGVLLGLQGRTTHGRGQVVDVSIFESVYNMMEAVVPEYSGAGAIREPSGSTLTGIVPTNTYLCADDKYVVIGGNGDSIYQRLMKCTGRDDLATDPRMADNAGRVKHEEEIDQAISHWTKQHSAAEILEALESAEVPSGPILSVADMFEDPHYRARGLFETVTVGDRELEIPAMHPKLVDTPGRTDTAGPGVGEHTVSVLSDLLGYDEAAIKSLQESNVV
jgi:crotonobetainyl-CoA:carnitine CoA-transferase CaiB-like acyl-CoA transferase